MRLLNRYIFFDVLWNSLGAIALFVAMLIAGNAMRDVAGLVAAGRVEGAVAAQLLFLLVPYVVSYALPMGVLTGILMVLGRLSAQREIVAMKSAGMSLYSIAAPVFLLAAAATCVALYINNFQAPSARAEYRTILKNMVRDQPLKFIVPGQFVHDFPGYVIYTQKREDNVLRGVWMWMLDGNDQATAVLRAREGVLAFDESEENLVLTVRSFAWTELGGEDTARRHIEARRFDLPLDELLGAQEGRQKRNRMTFFELSAYIDTLARELEALPPDVDEQVRKHHRVELSKSRMQMQQNFADAFSILTVSLIGIPLGIRISRRETYFNAGFALMLAISYKFLALAVEWLEEYPDLRPDLLAWLPNLLFLTIGLSLLVRANRH